MDTQPHPSLSCYPINITSQWAITHFNKYWIRCGEGVGVYGLLRAPTLPR